MIHTEQWPEGVNCDSLLAVNLDVQGESLVTSALKHNQVSDNSGLSEAV